MNGLEDIVNMKGVRTIRVTVPEELYDYLYNTKKLYQINELFTNLLIEYLKNEAKNRSIPELEGMNGRDKRKQY